MHTSEPDRVRASTADAVNQRIDRQIEENVLLYRNESQDQIQRRIWELDREWDIERMLEMMASSFSLTGIALGFTKGRRWFLLPTGVLSFLFMHAVQGWCPPIPILRRLGFRTREEIDRERYALKSIIGETDGSQQIFSPLSRVS
jgi:hypothetical protein